MVNLTEYKSIKVPAWVHQNMKQAELALARRGAAALPQLASDPQSCPACNSTVETFEAGYSFVRCNCCGYTQQKFDASSNFIGGALLGIGLGLLFAELAKGDGRA